MRIISICNKIIDKIVLTAQAHAHSDSNMPIVADLCATVYLQHLHLSNCGSSQFDVATRDPSCSHDSGVASTTAVVTAPCVPPAAKQQMQTTRIQSALPQSPYAAHRIAPKRIPVLAAEYLFALRFVSRYAVFGVLEQFVEN